MKHILVIFLGVLMITCSSPIKRANEVADYGEIIYRSCPTSNNVSERFLCKDEQNNLWLLRVADNGNIIESDKINGYKVISELEFNQLKRDSL